MPTYAPQHKILWLPMKLFMSDETQREIEAIFKDIGMTGNINAGLIEKLGRELTGDVFQITTHKALDLAPGHFSLGIIDSRRPSYTDLIQPNDLMLIQINGGEQNGKLENVMLGLVSRVVKATTINGERVQHAIQIIGQDAARWLYMGRTFFWFYAGIGARAQDGVHELSNRQEAFRNYFPNQGRSQLCSAEILKNILTGYISEFCPRVKQVFRWNAMPTKSVEAKFLAEDPILGLGERYIPNTSLDAYEGSFANLLLDHRFEYLAELWSDTTPAGGFAINYRRVPFDYSDWYAFSMNSSEPAREHHFIGDEEISSISVGRSDEEYYNFISTIPWVYGADTSIMRLLLDGTMRLDLSSIKDRGVRTLFLTNRYLDRHITEEIKTARVNGSFDDALQSGNVTMETPNPTVSVNQLKETMTAIQNKTSPTYKIADDWAATLWRWFSQMDRYYNGRVRVRGRPNIRVGHKIEMPSTTGQAFSSPMHFYVVGVGHFYSVADGTFSTELELTRGQPAERFIWPVTDGLGDRGEAEAAKESGTLESDKPLNPRPVY